MIMYKTFIILTLFFVSCVQLSKDVEILWDEYGIPHIYAQNTDDLFYAYGWAQAHAHGDLLLRLYGQARGQAAEYWGSEYIEGDQWMWIHGVPQRAERWAAAQNEPYRSMLEEFVQGVNDYSTKYPARINDQLEVVLPVSLTDIMAHTQRVIIYDFVFNRDELEEDISNRQEMKGSNAWAIAPARSASGNSMLVVNPHLPWGDYFTWFEGHFNLPNSNIYGASLVGFPAIGIMFNEYLGYTHTVNTIDGADIYELTLAGEGYMFDGIKKPFVIDSIALRIKTDSGFESETLIVKQSIHGPVVFEDDNTALALRLAGLDIKQILEERWEMATATNLIQFEASLQNLQTPLFTVMYADKSGNIMHFFGGRTPKRPTGDYNWSDVVSGNTSATLWNEIHTYDELPKVLNPESGWLQNANDPPWTTTFPKELDADLYPDYMAPREMGFRAQRSAKMLAKDASITFEELVAYKFSTRMELADRILDDLLDAAATTRNQEITDAAHVLQRWDRTTDNASRGSVLFKHWVDKMNFPEDFALSWKEQSPTQLPDGLRNRTMALQRLLNAAQEVQEKYGRLNVAWGEVFRLRRDSLDLPANGAPGDPYGVFRTSYYYPDADHKEILIGGDTYIAVIEFGDSIRAEAVLGYGNFSQPGSSHRTDQLQLVSDKKLRPIYFYREDVEAHTIEKTTF